MTQKQAEMGLNTESVKPHAVLIPLPFQGHINPMLQVAKILHSKGFHITFVNTEFNHKRLLKSRGANALDGLPDFQFETIPDGLPPTDVDDTPEINSLCDSTSKNCLVPFLNLVAKLNQYASSGLNPPVSCIFSDRAMSFSVKAAEEFSIPVVLLCAMSACWYLGVSRYHSLIYKDLASIKDESYLTNEHLDEDWVPGMKSLRLRELPSFFHLTDPNDPFMEFIMAEVGRASKASAIILNTFDELECNVLNNLSSTSPPIYTMGPLHMLVNQIPQNNLVSFGTNLWKEDTGCLQWLESKEPRSVLYVNFGSTTVMSGHQILEFAWGLANSKKSFLWIIRPDLFEGDSGILLSEFVNETKNRGLVASWCPQEQVLSHHSIVGYLTHCGWNSTMENLSCGVPMVCWPFFADNQVACKLACSEWGIGMEIDTNVKRDEVTNLVNELMEGEKGKEMKQKAMEWKKKAEDATGPNGSSYMNWDKLIKEVLLK
ncbi:Glycosyltransferase [Quillaja saponaria]|uniref:Glycosyltransferase n=1 Tax=Quillaja saponaria TaxID=32244 RepID=A0AAD7P956_QUISA|nr:Glycosyltransferase [Quillaja saponaria]